MTGLLAFRDRYADEQSCIAALASVRWPDGFVCAACGGRRGYRLNARPRVFECAVSRTRFPWTQNWLNRSVQGGPEHDR